MSRSCVVKCEPIALSQQTKLVSVWAVRTIKPNIEVTDNVDRLLTGGDLIEDDGQFVEEHLLYGG